MRKFMQESLHHFFRFLTILFNKNPRGSCGEQSSHHFRAFSSTSMYFAHGAITLNEALDSTKTGLRNKLMPFQGLLQRNTNHGVKLCHFKKVNWGLLVNICFTSSPIHVFLPKPPFFGCFVPKRRSSFSFLGLDQKACL